MSTRRPLPHVPPGAVGDTCITCGDRAVELTVVEILAGDARCQADDGGEELIAIELVDGLRPGDRVLAHAGVAIERLPEAPGQGRTDALR